MGIQGINRGQGSIYKQLGKKVLGYELNGEYKTTEFRILQEKKDTFTLSKEYKGFAEMEKAPEITGEGESVLVNNSFMVRLKEDKNERNWNLRFESADDLLSVVEDGYLEVNGKKIILSEKEQKDFKKIAEDVKKFNELKSKFSQALKEIAEGKEKAEAENEALKVQMNVLKITISYGSGKAVSPKDLNYLREKDPKMYALAVSMRAMQMRIEEDKKKKSIIEEEEEKPDEHIDAIEYDEDKIEIKIDNKENKISGITTVGEKILS